MAHRLIVNGELILYGVVGGGGFFFEDGFTSKEVVDALAEMSGDITARINSGGGFAWDGIAIYNAFKAHKGRVTIKVDAIAASAASIILMAGDQRVVPPSATVMIHNASGFTVGTGKDHRKTAEILDKLDGQMAQLYADATDQKVSHIKQMMEDETWLTGDEAVKEGFADEAPKDAAAAQASLFDYTLYAHAPEHLKKLAASFDRTKFTNAPALSADRKPRGLSAQNRTEQETTMTDAEKAAADKAAADKLAADKAAEATTSAAKITAAADDAKKAERKRSADITAACELAGMPKKATAYINSDKSLSEVVVELQADRAKTKPSNEVDPHHENAAGGTDDRAMWGRVTARINRQRGHATA